MKRLLIIVGLLVALATGVAQAQTRVGISLSFGGPHVAGQIVVGRPYYHPFYYSYHGYHRFYHSPRVIVVSEPRVVVVRPHRHYSRSYRRH